MKTDIFDNISQKLAPDQSVIDELLEKAEKKQFPVEPVIELNDLSDTESVPPSDEESEPEPEEPTAEKPRIKSRAGVFVAIAAAAALVLGIGSYLLLKGGLNVDTAASENQHQGQHLEALKKANANARLVFATVNSSCADLIADGRKNEIEQYEKSDNYGNVLRITDLKDASVDNWIDYSLYHAFEDSDMMDGYIYFELGENYEITFAQWAETDGEGIVGQYPDPESDPDKKHRIGQRIGDSYDQSNSQTDDSVTIDGLNVKIRYGTLTPFGLTLEFRRQTDLDDGVYQEILPEYGLYGMDGDLPVELDFVSDARGYKNRPGRLEKAGDELSFAYNWKDLYGELRPGNYRITVNVNTLGEGIDKTYGYNIDFTIEAQPDESSEVFNDLALSVTNVSQKASKTEAELKLTNTSDDTDVDVVCTGTSNIFEGSGCQLYEYKNGKYYEIPLVDPETVSEVETGLELKAGGSISQTFDLTGSFGDLTAGQYRLEFTFTLYSPDHKTRYTVPAVSCDFDIQVTQAEIPDVTGMDVIEAKQAISDAGFMPIIRNQYSDDVETDKIIRTRPAAGETADTNSEVQLLVSIGLVPDYHSKDWGLYGEVSNVTNTGCTLTIKSDGTFKDRHVLTGTAYHIGTVDENGEFKELPFIADNITWNAIALGVDTSEGGTTVFDINWECCFGVLPSGSYAVSKGFFINEKYEGENEQIETRVITEFEIP